MEADWEVEIGRDAPVLDPLWEGLINLRSSPDLVSQISEARQFPSMATALLRLNSADSSLRTTKCDVWPVDDSTQLDPYEMNADPGQTACGLACYFDVLPGKNELYLSLEEAEVWTRSAVAQLHQAEARCCRVDLVIRQAITPAQQGFGVTTYISACGVDIPAATEALGDALSIVASRFVGQGTTLPSLQGNKEAIQ